MMTGFLKHIGMMLMVLAMVIPSVAQDEDEAVIQPWPTLPYELAYDSAWNVYQDEIGVVLTNPPYALLFVSPPPMNQPEQDIGQPQRPPDRGASVARDTRLITHLKVTNKPPFPPVGQDRHAQRA